MPENSDSDIYEFHMNFEQFHRWFFNKRKIMSDKPFHMSIHKNAKLFHPFARRTSERSDMDRQKGHHPHGGKNREKKFRFKNVIY